VYGHPLSAAIPAIYQVATVAGLVVLARIRDFKLFRASQFVLFLTIPPLLQASLGGFVASSAVVLWAIFIPLAARALVGRRASLGG
jgi:adenylate cyclase